MTWLRLGRFALVLAFVLGALAFQQSLIQAAPTRQVVSLDPFYDPPVPLPPGQPGELIRWQAVPAPPGVKLWRILYHSTTLEGQDTAISGLIAAPDYPAPKGGFPVVTVAHGTTGIGRHCAPSLDPFGGGPGGEQALYPQLLAPFVSAGFVVAATDYQGLGAPGIPAYLVGEIEGRNVLDAARAVHSFPEVRTSAATFIWGHSEGGHAAAFAGELASGYAPELHLLGMVAAAPAAELGQLAAVPGPLAPALAEPSPATGFLMLIVSAWSRMYQDEALASVLTPPAREEMEAADRLCGLALLQTYGSRPVQALIQSNPATTAPWPEYLARNTPGSVRTAMPMLVVQGEADPLVLPRTTAAFVRRLCTLQNTVLLKEYPGADHSGVIAPAMPDILNWMRDRLSGRAVPSSCG